MQTIAGKVLLEYQLHVDPAHVTEHDLWYRQEFLPKWLTFPGFLSVREFSVLESGITGSVVSARRFLDRLTLFELETEAALHSKEYLAGVATPNAREIEMGTFQQVSVRGIYRQLFPAEGALTNSGVSLFQERGRALLHIGHDRDPDLDREINDYYNHPHLGELLSVAGFLSGRRFEAISAPHDYLTIYEVINPSVFGSEAYRKPGRRQPNPRAARGLTPIVWHRAVYQQTYPQAD